MVDNKGQIIEVKTTPAEPLEHRCKCGILLWAALKRQDLPAPGIVHVCPECGTQYTRIAEQSKQN